MQKGVLIMDRYCLILIFSTILLASCFKVNYGDGGFKCGEADQCPDGYYCSTDKTCKKKGVSDTDGGVLPKEQGVEEDEGVIFPDLPDNINPQNESLLSSQSN